MTIENANRDDQHIVATAAERAPWVRPTLHRMAAADAELGTQTTSNDGSFSTS